MKIKTKNKMKATKWAGMNYGQRPWPYREKFSALPTLWTSVVGRTL